MSSPDMLEVEPYDLKERLRLAEIRCADRRHSYKEARRFADDEHHFWQEARAEVARIRALLSQHSIKENAK